MVQYKSIRVDGMRLQVKKERTMRKVFGVCAGIALAAVLSIAAFAAEQKLTKEALDKNEDSKLSYIMAIDIGKNMKQMSNKLDLDIFNTGLREGYEGKDSVYTADEQKAFKQEYFKKMTEKFIAENTKKGDDFLAANKTAEGVQTTVSGLQYKVVTLGKGDKPKATDKVKVHYKGTLVDGKEFDSSYKRGEPVTFPLDQVIPAWTEGLQLMPVGSKYMLYVPAALGYGERGTPDGSIPPQSALIFEVELLSIEK
jgi:FKBP-type peptidyl-prolyl cis-trans isomerase FkpA